MGNALGYRKITARQETEPYRVPGPVCSPLDCFLPLTQRLFEVRDARPQGVIIGFTSVARGEGVSHVVTSLARKLAEHTFEQILVTTSAELATAAFAKFDDSAHVQRLSKPNSFAMTARAMRWEDLHSLRQRFGFVLVDCPALRVSPSVFTLANLCDGAVLVVAAGEASRSDIETAQKFLKSSSVKVMGTVLNKQTDPIPEFLSKVL